MWIIEDYPYVFPEIDSVPNNEENSYLYNSLDFTSKESHKYLKEKKENLSKKWVLLKEIRLDLINTLENWTLSNSLYLYLKNWKLSVYDLEWNNCFIKDFDIKLLHSDKTWITDILENKEPKEFNIIDNYKVKKAKKNYPEILKNIDCTFNINPYWLVLNIDGVKTLFKEEGSNINPYDKWLCEIAINLTKKIILKII